jgi:hypothetical protein
VDEREEKRGKIHQNQGNQLSKASGRLAWISSKLSQANEIGSILSLQPSFHGMQLFVSDEGIV